MKKLLLVLLFCVIPIISTAATFGYVYSGSETGTLTTSSYRSYMTSYTLSEDGTVSKLTALLQTTSGTENIKGLIYLNTAGVPGAVVAVSDPVQATTSKTSYDLTFSSPVELTAGDYYIGIVGDGSATNFFYAATGTHKTSSNNYPSPVNDPTEVASYDLKDCIYATYTAAAASTTPPFFSIINMED